jgi:hypothetical protein
MIMQLSMGVTAKFRPDRTASRKRSTFSFTASYDVWDRWLYSTYTRPKVCYGFGVRSDLDIVPR